MQEMDNKSKIEIAITVVAAIFLIFIVVSRVKKKTSPSASRKRKKIPVAVEKAKIITQNTKKAPPKTEEELLALQKERAEAPWGRDPFFFAEVKKVFKGSRLSLKGISVGKDGRGYVFINNDIYTVGDKVGDYVIMEIERDKILLRKGNNSFYLSMPEE